MEVEVTISVRNPEWYWLKAHLNEVGKEGRKSWEIINSDKIEKHIPSVTFGFGFEVTRIEESRSSEYRFPFQINGKTVLSLPLQDVTIVLFIGDTDNAWVVVSNSLIHQYIGVKQEEIQVLSLFLSEGEHIL